MKILVCWIILIIYPSVDGIQCHSPKNNLGTFIRVEWIDVLRNFLMSNLQPNEYEICAIDISIAYPDLYMAIDFTNDAVQSNGSIDGDVILNTFLIQDNKDNQSQYNILHYACSTDDYCELNFLFEHLYWLLNDRFQQTFIDNCQSILIGTYREFSERCHHLPGGGLKCPDNTLCMIALANNELEEGCTTSLYPRIRIRTKISLRNRQESRSISFECDYAGCSTRLNLAKLNSFIDQYYNLTSFRNALVFSQSNETTLIPTITTDLTTEFSSTTTAITSSSTKLSIQGFYFHSSLLILFFFVK